MFSDDFVPKVWIFRRSRRYLWKNECMHKSVESMYESVCRIVMKIAQLLDTSAEELVLGYRPVQTPVKLLEEMRSEYGGRISTMERRIADLEKLVESLEETIKTKNEIITMLKNKLAEDK